MPNYREKMVNLVAGDFRGYRRYVTGIPTGDYVTKAYMTFKAEADDPDPGLFQKTITTTNDPSQGQIVNTGASTGTAELYFRLLTTNTVLLEPGTTYAYDVQLHFASGADPITVIKGTVVSVQGVTAATT